MRTDGARISFLLAVVLLGCGTPATAQLSVGARVLAAQPVGDRGEGLDAGVGFGVDVGYDLRPGLSLYAGFSRTTFPVEGVEGADRVDSGIDAGVVTTRDLGGVPLRFRGGIVLHEAETHLAGREGGEDDGESGVGLESGVGVLLRLGRHLALTPGLAYTAYPQGDPGGVSQLRVEVGARSRL